MRSERIQRLDSQIMRVRAREEKRLVRVAREAGLFDQAMSTADLKALFTDWLEKHPEKLSQLRKLENAMARAKSQESTEARKLDARRKILLGSFLMAQVAHRPQDFTWVPRELEKFLEQHKDTKVVASNKAVLSDWLQPLEVPANKTAAD